MGSRWNLVFGQEPIPADPPDLSTLSSRWWVSSSHNSDTGPHWEVTFQHVMDPQTLDDHYIAGPQTGDDASPQSGKGVPFVLGQPAVCEQPEPCSKAAGLGQFPGKLGCPQIAFASRQSPPTTFRSAPGAPVVTNWYTTPSQAFPRRRRAWGLVPFTGMVSSEQPGAASGSKGCTIATKSREQGASEGHISKVPTKVHRQ